MRELSVAVHAKIAFARTADTIRERILLEILLIGRFITAGGDPRGHVVPGKHSRSDAGVLHAGVTAGGFHVVGFALVELDV